MPSPVVHSLAGYALGRFVRKPAYETRADVFFLAALVFAANAADLDFVPGILIGDSGRFHHGPVHSLCIAVFFGLLLAPFARYAGFRSAVRFACLMGLVYTSHLLLDMVSTDNGIRNGVPLFWPAIDRSLSMPFAMFIDIKHDSDSGGFVRSLLTRHNGYAMLWELVVISVVLALTRAGRWVVSVSKRR